MCLRLFNKFVRITGDVVFVPLLQICNTDDLDEGRMKHKEFCSKRDFSSGASVRFQVL